MARSLIVNVWVGGRGYGPDFGPDLPPEGAGLPDRVWSDGPAPEPPPAAPGTPEPSLPTEAPPPAPAVDLDALTRQELDSLAAGLGIKVDGRWGAPRLRQAIRDHQGGGQP